MYYTTHVRLEFWLAYRYVYRISFKRLKISKALCVAINSRCAITSTSVCVRKLWRAHTTLEDLYTLAAVANLPLLDSFDHRKGVHK